MPYFEGQTALVTGGGTGIGRATALKFASEGADVAVNYSRSAKEAEDTADEIRKMGRRSFAVKADVSDDAAVRQMVDAVLHELGRLDTLVCSAGTTRFVPLENLEDLTDAAWDPVFNVNVKGAFYCARAAIPVMKANGGGHIINVSSIAGLTGQGSSLAYAASKAALISVTKSLALSQAPDIRVNAVAPGVVDTRWVVGWEDFVAQAREATPLKRVASPEDVADVIFGLAVSRFVTGQTWVVDGGCIL
jgi:3-oxoacyl-[acyl-carrier protein] reductase